MSRPYPVSGYAFIPPAGWTDRSIHSFVLDEGGTTASLTVTHASIPDGAAPRDFVDQELHRLAHGLPDFKLVDRRDMVLDAGATELVECRWRTQHGTVDQLMAYLPEPGGLVVFTGAAPAPMPSSVRGRILAAMASARARGDGPVAGANDA